MKLYYAPGACSLSDHVALLEVSETFERVKLDLKTKRTESGEDYGAINPKGYVPAVILDTGETLTENVAILDWIALQHSSLMPAGPIGRSRQLEVLAYIAAEIHKPFEPFVTGGGDEEKKAAAPILRKRMQYLADTMTGDFLFGATLSAADCYLFVMSLWSRKNGLELPVALAAFLDRMLARPSVKAAMTHEGIR